MFTKYTKIRTNYTRVYSEDLLSKAHYGAYQERGIFGTHLKKITKNAIFI